jgi:hypothetical protein
MHTLLLEFGSQKATIGPEKLGFYDQPKVHGQLERE